MCAGALRWVLMAWISPVQAPMAAGSGGDGPPTAMLLDGAADMTGSTLAITIIPPAGPICLATWLALVFYACRDHPTGRTQSGAAAKADRDHERVTADRGAAREGRRSGSSGRTTALDPIEGDLMLDVHARRLATPRLVTLERAWLRARVRAGLNKTAAAVAAGAPIQPGEKVLISVRMVSAALVVATVHAVYLQDDLASSWSRLGWEDVDQVFWDDEQRTLTLIRASGRESSPVVLRLARSVPLVDFARERVTSTILARAPLLCGGRVCGWLTARRPHGSDQVRWVLTLRDATASRDPALQARVAGAIAALEADLGLESWRPHGHAQQWWPQS